MKKIKVYITVMAVSVLALTSCKSKTTPLLGKSSIEDVIEAMTLEEKVALVVGTGLKFGDSIDKNSPFPIPNQPVPGSLAAKSKVYVSGAVGRTLEIPRLGVNTIEMVDGPAGVSFMSRSTAYPIGTALSSSWDVDLVHKIGECMGNETLEYGLDILLAPAINIHRNPLTGRNFEYFSEDPLLSGKMGAALVNGIQSQGAGTSLKHFVANNQETNRIEVDAIISERALREIYLKGFEIAIKESNPWTLMASYNSVNGNLATENYDLLTKVAREDWGYEGIIMSDWEAGKDPVKQMKTGLNLLMPGPYQDTVLLQAVKDKKLDEKVLDENISWILKGAMKVQKFKDYKYSNKPNLEENASIARSAAAQGMVLLKNENQALPLLDKGQNLALFGNGSYETIVGGSGSGFVMRAGPTVHIIEGLKNQNFNVSKSLEDTYTAYISENTPPTGMIDMTRGRKKRAPEMLLDEKLIQTMANESDLAIITIARISGETADRSIEGNFKLTEVELSNINNVSQAFHAKGKKVVVVLNIGGVIETASWKDLPDSILIAWQPGQEAGNSIADVLSGNVNPSGKLTASFPMKYEDEPSANNFPGTPADNPKHVIYEEGIYVGYRYYNTFGVETSYPFGFGLSYTNFSFGDLSLSSTEFKDELEASITVTNEGELSGKEVVQLYVSAPTGNLEKPVQELKAFAKTKNLAPKESQTITFKIDISSLTSFDAEESAWIAEAGQYIVKIGVSSEDIKAEKSFNLGKDRVVQKVNRALIPQVKINELSAKQ
ncbi:beta-glucosidase [Aestuariibaculum lutulentum]|uniref:Glycoside hydrolase family 3 C-terminal domain-containing protein n=1 Tax=Aestuariibaculum lutulentum TaxID=2920935 RepID=A0ABS9RMU3_9FLAO|nr:glycoside hydrolase family 3 C-terminal domain-containing protein [Aestuariibaculum lutulentum]MCH4553429.1 glycoside hydrolase family 3 C-terminal domain-containing protein [Aestuariibaculum lutulentum]